MEKILLLSPFGREGEPEDLAYLDIYLLSLKKQIVPHFDVKVILLYTGGGDLQLTRERISHLGLDNVIILKKITEMDLPAKSVDFWKSQAWFHKVGLNMNLLFDYAKRNDYFGAEWIIHVDTDLEFLPNFKTIFDKISPLTEINPNLLVTVAGDTFEYHFKYENKEYYFVDPTRINWYDESGETLKNTYVYRNIQIQEKPDRTKNTDYSNLVFCIQQQKIRNDFIIMPKVTANQYGSSFNWISYYYPPDFKAVDVTKQEQIEFQNIYEANHSDNNSNLRISINNDKGSTVQFFMQGGEHTITKLQLIAGDQMITHYGSGWYMGVNFIEQSYKSLQKNYPEYAYLFEIDFANSRMTVDEIQQKINQMEEAVNKLKQILSQKTIQPQIIEIGTVEVLENIPSEQSSVESINSEV